MSDEAPVEITPIYGWGWTIEGTDSTDPPAKILVAPRTSESGRIVANIVEESPAFAGRIIHIRRRHAQWDGCVNVVISDEAGAKLASGYAKIEPDEDAFAALKN